MKPKINDQKALIEKRLRRTAGMSDEARERMHKASEELPWTGRCWNCKTTFTALRSQITTCQHCGVNLWKREPHEADQH